VANISLCVFKIAKNLLILLSDSAYNSRLSKQNNMRPFEQF